jgi:hypothetical protein
VVIEILVATFWHFCKKLPRAWGLVISGFGSTPAISILLSATRLNFLHKNQDVLFGRSKVRSESVFDRTFTLGWFCVLH